MSGYEIFKPKKTDSKNNKIESEFTEIVIFGKSEIGIDFTNELIIKEKETYTPTVKIYDRRKEETNKLF